LMNFGPIDPFLSVKCRGMYMSTWLVWRK
jgi:hypothetical protein